MADDRELITADALDAMTPDERAQVFNDRILSNLDRVPAGFKARVEATAQRLSEQHRNLSEG